MKKKKMKMKKKKMKMYWKLFKTSFTYSVVQIIKFHRFNINSGLSTDYFPNPPCTALILPKKNVNKGDHVTRKLNLAFKMAAAA